jgi:hypothetical protein
MNPRPGFISASRQRLIQRIKQEEMQKAVAAASPRVSWWSRLFGTPQLAFRLAIALILLAFLFSLTSGIALASQSALPGDVLYGVKTGLEKAAVAISPDPERQVELHIEYAQRRLNEIQELSLEGRYDEIPIAVEILEQQVDQAITKLERVAQSNPGSAKVLASSLQDTLENQTALMRVLAEAAPASAVPDIERAISISVSALAQTEEIIDQVSSPPPGPTASPVVIPSMTPVPSETPTPPASPTLPPSPVASGTVTPTGTPTPTIVAPTSSPEPRVKPTDEGGTPPSTYPTPTSPAPPEPTETKPPPPPPTEPPPTEPPPTEPPPTEPPPTEPPPTEVPPEPTKEPKPTKTPKPTNVPPDPTRRPVEPPVKTP